MNKIFEKSLIGTTSLLKAQLENAHAKGLSVKVNQFQPTIGVQCRHI
jgi:hypothetical protein